MFIDEAEITITGGRGGNGGVAFFPNKGGPAGGNGGNGGNVYVKIDENISDLKKYVQTTTFHAGNGESGSANRRDGATGKDIILHLPKGTTIIDMETNWENELNRVGMNFLVCQGGRGGLGNNALKTSTNTTPRTSEPGKPGQTKRLKLVLKLIADYGLVGLPNAGKSSLLNMLTAANVKTANYPFTTLEPNLGVYNGKIIADIPGLIEGASIGKGLGIKFLKHIEKVGVIFHCISVESADPVKDYLTVTEEMGKFNKKLLEIKTYILLTKTDLLPDAQTSIKKSALSQINKEVHGVSIHNAESLGVLKSILS